MKVSSLLVIGLAVVCVLSVLATVAAEEENDSEGHGSLDVAVRLGRRPRKSKLARKREAQARAAARREKRALKKAGRKKRKATRKSNRKSKKAANKEKRLTKRADKREERLKKKGQDPDKFNPSKTGKRAIKPIKKYRHVTATIRVLEFSDNPGKMIAKTKKRLQTRVKYDLDQARFKISTEGNIKYTIYSFTEDQVGKDGKTLKTGTIKKGKKEFMVSGLRGKLFGVLIQGNRVGVSKYVVRLERPNMGKVWQAKRNNLGPICGISDLHLHQASSLSFGGDHFNGKFRGPVSAAAADPPFVPKIKNLGKQYQQAHTKMMKEAHKNGLNVAIVTAVSNELMCGLMVISAKEKTLYPCDDMDSAVRQIEALISFSNSHKSWYRIARDPWEARQIVHSGKMAVILGVEVSHIMPKRAGKWKDQLHQLYDMGVRLVQLNHQSDSFFSGAAPHAAVLKIVNGIKWWGGFKKRYDKKVKQKINIKGITSMGADLIKEMRRLHMIIDTAHMSLKAVRDVAKLTNNGKDYGVINSHCRPRTVLLDQKIKKKLGEFMCYDETIDLVKGAGGVIGMRVGPENYETVKDAKGKSVANNCDGSSTAVAQMYNYFRKKGVHTAIGSDASGYALMVGPRFGKDACPNPRVTDKKKQDAHRIAQVSAQGGTPKLNTEFDTKGMADVGLEGDLVKDMSLLGADVTDLANSAENLLRVWERSWSKSYNKKAYHPIGKKTGKMVCPQYVMKGKGSAGGDVSATVDKILKKNGKDKAGKASKVGKLGPVVQEGKGPDVFC